jgi:hypothetical protein
MPNQRLTTLTQYISGAKKAFAGLMKERDGNDLITVSSIFTFVLMIVNQLASHHRQPKCRYPSRPSSLPVPPTALLVPVTNTIGYPYRRPFGHF